MIVQLNVKVHEIAVHSLERTEGSGSVHCTTAPQFWRARGQPSMQARHNTAQHMLCGSQRRAHATHMGEQSIPSFAQDHMRTPQTRVAPGLQHALHAPRSVLTAVYCSFTSSKPKLLVDTPA